MSGSTLSFGLSAQIHAAFKSFDAALVLNIANGLFLPLLRAAGVPTVLNTDGIEWERGKWGVAARRTFYLGARMSARHATVLVCDSRAIGTIWQQQFGVASRFIPYGGVIHAGLDHERILALGLSPRRYVLAVARLIPENNVALTIEALEEIQDPPPAVIVGSLNYASSFERRLRRLDHQGRIRWLGHVSDQALLTQLWAHCGAYVHGHSVGGTNPALLQAMGAGAPTLALDTPFNREVIEAQEQLFPPDRGRLAAELESLLRDPDRQFAWGQRAQKRVMSAYNWDDVCDAYLDALDEARARMHG